MALGFRVCGAIVVNVCMCVVASAFPHIDLVDAFQPNQGYSQCGCHERSSRAAPRRALPRKYLRGRAKEIGRAY